MVVFAGGGRSAESTLKKATVMAKYLTLLLHLIRRVMAKLIHYVAQSRL